MSVRRAGVPDDLVPWGQIRGLHKMRVSLAFSPHLVQHHPKVVMRFGKPRGRLDGRLEMLFGALPLALAVRWIPSSLCRAAAGFVPEDTDNSFPACVDRHPPNPWTPTNTALKIDFLKSLHPPFPKVR